MKPAIIIMFALLLTAAVVSAAPDFSVDLVSARGIEGTTTSWEADQEESVGVTVNVYNRGGDGTMKVEAGLYLKSKVEDWYNGGLLSTIANEYDIPNCIAGENNVDTKVVELSSGASLGVDFFLTAPLDHEEEYLVHVTAFQNCYVDDPDTGQTDYDTHAFTIIDAGITVVETCVDGINNQDETDTDCGGSCPGCPERYECDSDSDCADDLVCVDEGRSGDEYCAVPGVTPPPKPFTLPWLWIGVVAAVAILIGIWWWALIK